MSSGLCKCGCGGKTPISKRNETRHGYVKGEPKNFIRGHQVRPSVEERFWANTQPGLDESECWPWFATKTGDYGIMRVNGRRTFAHRISHTLFIGAIPEGYEVDHVRARGCAGPPCVNPAHLEAVTPEENMRRTRGVPKGRKRATG